MQRVEFNKEKISVLIVDDSEFYRRLLAKVLSEDRGVEIVGECLDGDQVCSFLASTSVDIIIMDGCMERMNGDLAAIEVLRCHPTVQIIAFSSNSNKGFRERMMKSGVKEFINKNSSISNVSKTIKSVYESTQFQDF